MISIHCTVCNKRYDIHEEKLSAGKTLSLRCPGCQVRINVRKDGTPTNENQSIRGAEMIGKELITEIIKTSRALPPMPQIVFKAMNLLSCEDANFKEVGEVLEADQAMATRVLRLANSAYYGLSMPVSSVQQASAVLGFQTLFQMITVVSSSKMMGQRIEGYGMEADDIWKHSLAVAFGAKAISERRFPELVNHAFMAGLIHDAGMLILDPRVQKKIDYFELQIYNGKTIQDTEMEMFGFDHGEIAADYLKNWNIPEIQLHAIRFHHYPSRTEGDILSYILHVADAIANREDPEQEMNFILEDDILVAIGFEPEELDALCVEVEESVDQIIESLR